MVILLFAAMLAGFGLVIYIMNQRLKELKNSSAVEMVKGDMTELSRVIARLQESMGDKLERNNASVQQAVGKQLTESAKLVADVTQLLRNSMRLTGASSMWRMNLKHYRTC